MSCQALPVEGEPLDTSVYRDVFGVTVATPSSANNTPATVGISAKVKIVPPPEDAPAATATAPTTARARPKSKIRRPQPATRHD